MNDFSPHLQHLSSRLPLPDAVRSRVVLEMASDMQDLLQYHLDRGMGRDEAVRAVEERFQLSDEALRELVAVHSTTLQHSLEGLSRGMSSTWERALLALVALFLVPGLALHILRSGVLEDASPLAYALLLVLGVALVIILWKGIALFRRGSRRLHPLPRQGLRALPVLALLLLAMGFSGIWVELYRTSLEVREVPGQALRFLVEWMHMASATLVVALSGSLLTGLLWFFFESRAAHLEKQEASRFLEASP